MNRIWISLACFLAVSPAFAEQLEMEVITVYGKETYRLRKEIFELLAPMRKEELVRMKLKKHVIEEVAAPAAPQAVGYDTTYLLQPAGEVPTVTVVKTGVLLYFLTRKDRLENLHLEFISRDDVSQDFYLKGVAKDQYVEINLPEGLYRMKFTAEGMTPAVAETIVIRPGQISLALMAVDEKPAPPPPPPPPVVEPPAPPPPPERRISVQLVPLRKAARLPEAQPVLVTRGRIKYQDTGLAQMQVRLYEKEVGFFDPYDPAVEDALLAVTVTDTFGNFEFPPIDNIDGFLEGTRDPVIVLSLENRRLSIVRPFALTRAVPYRYVIYQRDNVNPDAGNLDVGEIAVALRKERPVLLYQRALELVSAWPYPIQIVYPSGSRLSLSKRRLDVPADVELAALSEYLGFLAP